MSSKMRLIWDFRGLRALQIAEKYKITLNKFIQQKQYSNKDVEVKQYSMFYAIVQLVVNIEDVEDFRRTMKPDRGEEVE